MKGISSLNNATKNTDNFGFSKFIKIQDLLDAKNNFIEDNKLVIGAHIRICDKHSK